MPADVGARSVEGIRCTYMVRAYREISSILKDLTLNVPEAFKLFPWIVREYKRGNLNGYIAGLPYRNQEGQVIRPSFDRITNENITEIRALLWRLWRHLEYVRANPKLRSPNIMEMSYDDAEQWCNQREVEGTDVGDAYRWDAHQPLLKFEDGWAWYRLETRDDLRQEGDIMGNCVGGYTYRVENEQTTILSLRDNRGIPHTTLEIPGTPLKESGSEVNIYQIQGNANTEPKEAYKERARQLIEWLRAQGHEVYATANSGDDDEEHYVTDADSLMEWYGGENDNQYTLGGRAADYGLTHREEGRQGCDISGSLTGLAMSCMENQINYGDHTGEDLAQALADAAEVNGITEQLPEAYSAAEQIWEEKIGEALEGVKDRFEEEFRQEWIQERVEQLQAEWSSEYERLEAEDNPDALNEWEYDHPEPDESDVDEREFGHDFELAWDNREEEAREDAESEWPSEAPDFLEALRNLAFRRHSRWFILAGFQRYSADIHVLAAEKRAELLNRADVKDWCENQAKYLTDKTARPFTMEQTRLYLAHILQTIEDGNYKLMEWAWREFKRGTIHYPDNPGVHSAVFVADVNRFGNWLRWCEEYHRPAPDWKARAFGYQAMMDWMAQMGTATPDFDPNAPQWENRETVYTYPDGWTIDLVTTPVDLSLEGQEMGHCVGGYGSNVEGGNSIIYSLRDARGYPHVTFEVEGTGQRGTEPHNTTGYNWDIIQIQGKEDTEPIREYKQRIGDFLHHLSTTFDHAFDLRQDDGENEDWEDGPFFEVNNVQDLLDLGMKLEDDPEDFTEPDSRDDSYYDDDYRLHRSRLITVSPHAHSLQDHEDRLVAILKDLLSEMLQDPQSVLLDQEDQGEGMSLGRLREIALGTYGVCAMNFKTYRASYDRDGTGDFYSMVQEHVLDPLNVFVEEYERRNAPQGPKLISEEDYNDYQEEWSNRIVGWFLTYLDRLFARSQELRQNSRGYYRDPADMRQMRGEVNPFHSRFPGALSHRKARLIDGVLVPEWDRHLVGV